MIYGSIVTFYLRVFVRYLIAQLTLITALYLFKQDAAPFIADSIIAILFPVMILIIWDSLAVGAEYTSIPNLSKKSIAWLLAFTLSLRSLYAVVMISAADINNLSEAQTIKTRFVVHMLGIIMFYICLSITPRLAANRFLEIIEKFISHKYFVRTAQVLTGGILILLLGVIISSTFKDDSEFKRNSEAYDRAKARAVELEGKYVKEKCAIMTYDEKAKQLEKLQQEELTRTNPIIKSKDK